MYIQRSGIITAIERPKKMYGMIAEVPEKYHEYQWLYEYDGEITFDSNLVTLLPFKLTKTYILYEKVYGGVHELCRDSKAIRVWLNCNEAEELYKNPKDFIEYLLNNSQAPCVSLQDIRRYQKEKGTEMKEGESE